MPEKPKSPGPFPFNGQERRRGSFLKENKRLDCNLLQGPQKRRASNFLTFYTKKVTSALKNVSMRKQC
jgi:hypothetical protein